LDGCTALEKLQCRCEKLENVSHAPLIVPDKSKRPEHAQLRVILMERYHQVAQAEQRQQDDLLRLEANPAAIPAVYRGMGSIRVGQ
jgi:hypothetical protein